MKKGILSFLCLVLVYFLSSAQAQIIDVDQCKQGSNGAQDDAVCGNCERDNVEALLGSDLGADLPNDENATEFKNGILADLGDPNKEVQFPGDKDSLGKSKKVKVSDLKSVEDFVEFLPDAFKKNVVFMAPSRSLQEGDRYLLKSPNSEIVMSFNSHPQAGGDVTQLRGGKAVELQVWNGVRGVWELVEIDFSRGKPKVSRNPQKCLNCHGTGQNTRPNFDPYNFWSQTKPFFRGELNPGTQEAAEYLEFLKKIRADANARKNGGPATRFSVLAPMLETNKIEDIEKAFARGEKYRLKVDESDNMSTSMDGASAVNLFDQMYLTNHCRLANLTTNPKHNQFADQMKYALKAAVLGCITRPEQLNDYIPEPLQKKFKAYFKGMGMGDGSYADVRKDMEGKQKDYYEDRIGRKLWNLEESFLKKIQESTIYKNKIRAAGDNEQKVYEIEIAAEKEAYKKAKDEMEVHRKKGRSIVDKEQSIDMLGAFRYMLDPLGVDTSMFSLSVDPQSYTFGDFFNNINRFGEFKKMGEAGETCESLKPKSMEALSQGDVLDKMMAFKAPCKPDAQLGLDPAWKKNLDDVEKQALKQVRIDMKDKVEDVFGYCVGCHSSGTLGAPPIPFDDFAKFDRMLEKQSGELGDFGIRIWKRVIRHGDKRGAMPMSMGQLEPEELDTIKKYLESFPSRNYVRRIDTGVDRNMIQNVNQVNN